MNDFVKMSMPKDLGQCLNSFDGIGNGQNFRFFQEDAEGN